MLADLFSGLLLFLSLLLLSGMLLSPLIQKTTKLPSKCPEKIIDINPEHYKSYFNVGYMNFETGDYKEAIRNWDIATRMSPFYPQAYYMKGLTYQILGSKKDAKLNYEQALEQDPEYALAKEALGELK